MMKMMEKWYRGGGGELMCKCLLRQLVQYLFSLHHGSFNMWIVALIVYQKQTKSRGILHRQLSTWNPVAMFRSQGENMFWQEECRGTMDEILSEKEEIIIWGVIIDVFFKCICFIAQEGNNDSVQVRSDKDQLIEMEVCGMRWGGSVVVKDKLDGGGYILRQESPKK